MAIAATHRVKNFRTCGRFGGTVTHGSLAVSGDTSAILGRVAVTVRGTSLPTTFASATRYTVGAGAYIAAVFGNKGVTIVVRLPIVHARFGLTLSLRPNIGSSRSCFASIVVSLSITGAHRINVLGTSGGLGSTLSLSTACAVELTVLRGFAVSVRLASTRRTSDLSADRKPPFAGAIVTAVTRRKGVTFFVGFAVHRATFAGTWTYRLNAYTFERRVACAGVVVSITAANRLGVLAVGGVGLLLALPFAST